jgi:hypothetical protein
MAKDTPSIILVDEEAPVVINESSLKYEISGNDLNMSNWEINALEDGNIEANNSNSGNKFVGTIAEFNSLFKG